MTSSPARRAYLDTSAQAERVLGCPPDRARLEQFISEADCVATQYVREQFRATFLRASILVYNQLRSTQDALATLRNFDQYRVCQRGEGVKARKVLYTLLEAYGDVPLLLATLKRWIEFEMMDRFDDGVAAADGTGCALCDDVEVDEHGTYFLRRSCTIGEPRPCHIETFWTEREPLLAAQAAYPLASLDQEQQTAGARSAQTAAKEVLVGKKPPRGNRCTVALSDSVIVCESPEGSVLVTTNVGDFVAISTMIGGSREVINPLAAASTGKPPAGGAPGDTAPAGSAPIDIPFAPHDETP